MPKFIEVLLVLLVYFASSSQGSCWRYGHACWGGHGKRSGSAPVSITTTTPSPNTDWDAADSSRVYYPMLRRSLDYNSDNAAVNPIFGSANMNSEEQNEDEIQREPIEVRDSGTDFLSYLAQNFGTTQEEAGQSGLNKLKTSKIARMFRTIGDSNGFVDPKPENKGTRLVDKIQTTLPEESVENNESTDFLETLLSHSSSKSPKNNRAHYKLILLRSGK